MSMSTMSPLEAMADELSAATKIITGYCTLEGILQPSFDPEAPSVTIPHAAPRYVREARQRLLSASKKLLQLATEPSEYLPNIAVQYQYISCLKWLGHFQVFAAIPLQGSVPYPHLASICSVPERQLRSVVRMTMTSGCLCEPQQGEVAHNAVSRRFVTHPANLGWVRFMTDFYLPVSSSMAEATEKWGDSEKKNETAANFAMKTPLTTFDFITGSREYNRYFSAYMKATFPVEGTTVRHLLADFDWARLENGLVVHIGGSPGAVSIALAEAFPQLRFVVQDSQDQIEVSRAFLRAKPESIRSRIGLSAYNHNVSLQPVKDANVYMLRMILHNQTDADATRVLANMLPVLKANMAARLLIVDTVLPEPGSAGILDEALERYRDLTMKQNFNTTEREVNEWHSLLEKVGDGAGRLSICNIEKSPGSALSCIEVAYQPYDNDLMEDRVYKAAPDQDLWY